MSQVDELGSRRMTPLLNGGQYDFFDEDSTVGNFDYDQELNVGVRENLHFQFSNSYSLSRGASPHCANSVDTYMSSSGYPLAPISDDLFKWVWSVIYNVPLRFADSIER